MNVYLLVIRPDTADTIIDPDDPSSDDSPLLDYISSKLALVEPNVYALVPDTVWMIGTTMGTCHDVLEKMELFDPQDALGRMLSTVIVKCDDYNGFAESSLWEKVEHWERIDG